MKQLFAVLVVLVLAVSLGFAQNSSTINQAGTDNLADVSQSGALNQSFITQLPGSYDNVADVDQNGAANFSMITQLSGVFFPRGMHADVNQSGAGNTSVLDMKEWGEHFSTITQVGTSNSSVVIHERNSGVSVVDQNGSGNQANLHISAIGGGYVRAYQTGANNIAVEDMGAGGAIVGANNTFESHQTGVSNYSQQTMVGVAADFIAPVSNDNMNIINQNGASNIAYQFLGNGTDVTAGNASTINQDGVANYAATTQIGMNNTATVTQLVAGQTSLSVQNGTGNVLVVTQHP